MFHAQAPRSDEIERVSTITLLWAELNPVPDEATVRASPPCETVAPDAPSHDPDPINRATKQVTCERIAVGSWVLEAEVPAREALDTAFAGERVTVPCADLATV
jgi:hypothetical protein